MLHACENISEENVQRILHTAPYEFNVESGEGGGGGREEGGLDEKHIAVLAYTDAMTLDVAVPETVFARLRAAFGDREVVEITAAVAAYNCVSRFLVALDVGERNGVGVVEGVAR